MYAYVPNKNVCLCLSWMKLSIFIKYRILSALRIKGESYSIQYNHMATDCIPIRVALYHWDCEDCTFIY